MCTSSDLIRPNNRGHRVKRHVAQTPLRALVSQSAVQTLPIVIDLSVLEYLFPHLGSAYKPLSMDSFYLQ